MEHGTYRLTIATARHRVFVRAAILAGLGIVSGCGDSGGRVAGTIRYRGSPVARGEVSFYNEKTGRGGMAAIETGRFSLSHPLDPGTYGVTVIPPQPGRPEDPIPECRDIPSKYHQGNKSPLSFTVKPGQNAYEIELE